MPLPIQWTANIVNNKEAKEAFEESVLRNSDIINRLKDIILQREESLIRKSISSSSYSSNPSWAYEQAHINGRLEEIQSIKQLLTLE